MNWPNGLLLLGGFSSLSLSLSLSLFLSLSLSLSWMMMVTVVVVQALGNIGKGCFAFVGRGPLADVASIQIILFGKKRD